MSPIGGQGSLRLMYRANVTNIRHHELRYLDNGPLGNTFAYYVVAVGNDGGYTGSMKDVYSAGLMQSTSTKTSPLDQWGNVKIPRLPEANASKADTNGWIPVPQDAVQVEAYSSLFGLPIVGLEEFNDRDLNFTVETAYLDLSCPPIDYVPNTPSNHDFSILNITCLDCVYSQSEIGKVRSASLLGPPLPEFTVAEKENATISAPRTIHFSSFVKHLSQVSCAVTQRLVETFIECIAGNCAATKIRPSRTDHRSENVTSFDYWASDALDMITEDSKVRQSGPSSATSASALFLQRPDLLPLQIIGQDISSVKGGFVNLSTINPEVFEARASMLLNAVLQTFMSPTEFAGNLPTNFTKYGPGHIPAKGLVTVANNKSAWAEADPFNLPPPIWHLADPETPFLGASTNATVTRYTEVYKPSYAWVVLLVLSAALLFCAGAIGIIVRFATIIPDFFDPVLGLTYSNEYMPPVAQQGLLNPEERLKVLARTRVQLGYVDDGGMFKKVVFGEADRVKPLEKGTLYQ
ncbi:hypothetical protein PHISCL_05060 [Aspergillus sclerotialis]|uniref:Uncharacterized protein n=1 Tax=Aspergillus sclerotialis TaxID=2070753 RepID=A0A3A2ZHK4_9EURO|nr:hypothetical protein PHISCL_05060 [Aspergillus sclerotialis]